MKRIIFFISILISLVSITHVFASTATLNSIVSKYQSSGIKIGVAVHSAKDQKEIYSYHSEVPLNPASTMKVLTSSLALKHLGGSFVYKTVLSTDSFSGGTIDNLYVQGVGDPSVVEERLWKIAKDLKVRGVKEIRGDIVIDNSYFDSLDFAGRSDENARAYNAMISAFAVNFNSFAVVATNFAGALEVHVDPPTNYFKLLSHVKGSGNSLGISRVLKDGFENVTATGGVTTEKIKYANVSDPVQYAGTTLEWVLESLGISFHGTIRSGIASGKRKLIKDKSKPLSLIIRDLNKYSNNFTAEMILKTLAAQKLGAPGTTEKGTSLLKKFLQEIGVDASEYSIFNGSGLSRNNRISANALNHVLLSTYKNNKLRSDFMASLAIAGTDGTLESRMKAPGIMGNVKAKTGTLNDVSALSGYMETLSGKMMAFTILVNGPAAGAGSFYEMQQSILLDLYQND